MKAKTLQNRNRAIALRSSGLTYREIAERLGVSPHTAYRYVNPVVKPSETTRGNSTSDKKFRVHRPTNGTLLSDFQWRDTDRALTAYLRKKGLLTPFNHHHA